MALKTSCNQAMMIGIRSAPLASALLPLVALALPAVSNDG